VTTRSAPTLHAAWEDNANANIKQHSRNQARNNKDSCYAKLDADQRSKYPTFIRLIKALDALFYSLVSIIIENCYFDMYL